MSRVAVPSNCRRPVSPSPQRLWSSGVVLSLMIMVAGCSNEPSTESDPSGEHRQATGREVDFTTQPAPETAGGPSDDAQSPENHLSRGDAAMAGGRVETALEHFKSIPRDGSDVSLQAAVRLGRLQESLGRLSQAIASYEYVLDHDSTQTTVMGRLAELYALTGQRSEADDYLSQLVKTPDLGFKQLVLLTDFQRRSTQDFELLQQLERQTSDDPAVQLGLALEDFNRGDITQAKGRLESIVETTPQLAPAQALLGEILLLEASDAALRAWHRQLPEVVLDHPAIWYVRGLWAQRLDDPQVAAHCFWESARQSPTSYRAIHQLGRVLSQLEPATGQEFAERAEELYTLQQQLSLVLDSGGRDESALQQLVEMLLDSGREWEAWSWTIIARGKQPDADWIPQVLARLSAYPQSSAPRILDSRNLLVKHDLSGYPDFGRIASTLQTTVPEPDRGIATGAIRFDDQAAALGVDFSYHRGRAPGVDGVRMQESTGGGVGVLDYDNDGWPDLFLTQGEDWPAGATEPAGSDQFRDSLFRNRGSRFEETTDAAAMPVENGYGQGCACGDFDSDGFIDIYVANIGSNQLLMNNGDGTFSEVTPDTVRAKSDWTTSCVIADLNSDGEPDLFDVNYVAGELLFQITCDEHDCSPEAYDEAPDYIHLSMGDGTTQLVEPPEDDRVGAGLGVVVFRADRFSSAGSAGDINPGGNVKAQATPVVPTPEPYLSLFIANDQDPNAFLRVVPSSNPQTFVWSDESYLSGLALDKDGKTTACMGVASGDVTGDGRLDLFVTNYKDESNTLYVQNDGALFDDAIGGSGLLLAGLPYVGWGTQFLDADNNGSLDIVVANGHVGEFAGRAGQDRMPTQVFRNEGGGHFVELVRDDVGSFFQRQILGRSLATLDWNRDGRVDFVVSLLDENIGLLTNQTDGGAHWLRLRLSGTEGSRDAVGTVVTITTDAGILRSQLTAGDGYQATNERVLHFGLHEQDNIETVFIEWPSGRTQAFHGVPVDATLLATEGRKDLLAAPQP